MLCRACERIYPDIDVHGFSYHGSSIGLFCKSCGEQLPEKKTPVYEVLQDKCEDIFSLKNLSRLQGGKEISNEKDTETEPTRIEQAKIIDSLALPELLKASLQKTTTPPGYASLAVSI